MIRNTESTKSLNVQTIPQELKERDHWVLWDSNKRPKQPSGKPASPTDPNTWCSFDDAYAAYQTGEPAGIGFVFGQDDGLFGVDLDACRNPDTGEIAPEAQEIIDSFDTYTEISPSGTGVKIFGRGRRPDFARNKSNYEFTVDLGGREKSPAVEIYDCERYFTVTSNATDDHTALEDCQAPLDELCRRLWPPEETPPESNIRIVDSGIFPASTPQVLAEVLKSKNAEKLWELWKGGDAVYATDSEADSAMLFFLAPYVGPDPNRLEEIARESHRYREKWDGKRGKETWIGQECRKAIEKQRKFHDWGTDCPMPQLVDASCLIEQRLELAEEVIPGLLRKGETANLIAPPKSHKSFMVADLCLSVASGTAWMGAGNLSAQKRKVLLLDNELHKEVLANRIRRISDEKFLSTEDYQGCFNCDCLRGRLTDITQMDRYMAALAGERFELIILDSLYRFWPPDASENDNAAATAIFNRLDRWAQDLGCAFLAVHHASKGSQGNKAVTDVGAGAGAIARAADTHITLRPHEEDDCVVMDAVSRSFPPFSRVTLQWKYPLWTVSSKPPKLKVMPTGFDRNRKEKDEEAMIKLKKIIDEAGKPLTRRKIRDETGWGSDRANRIIRLAIDCDAIRKTDEQIIVRGKPQDGFVLVEDPQKEIDS
jgi:hypothetical protein